MLAALKSVVRVPFRALGYDVVRIQGPRTFPHPAVTPKTSWQSAKIAFPTIDTQASNPIPSIMQAPEFRETVAYFSAATSANRSLLSPDSQALLFAMVRNLRPENVVEIGTFRAGTSEVLCRALQANGSGKLHTVDPFGGETVPRIIADWPEALCRHVIFYPVNSMTFFMEAKRNLQPSLIFVDGDHDYEFVAFDIWSAARLVAPGGFIFIDNISQLGPFLAGCELLKGVAGWRECSNSVKKYRPGHSYDLHRASVHNTDFMILRAPSKFVIGERAVTTRQAVVGRKTLRGIAINIAECLSEGALSVQCIVRGFGEKQTEWMSEATADIHDKRGILQLDLKECYHPDDTATSLTVELWLTWVGDRPLELATPPHVF
jgi:predicted O-methyltransferase YrrM